MKLTRWTVADLLNRLPWVCWADVVFWVSRAKEAPSRNSSQRLLRTSGDGDTYGLLWMNGTRDCRADAARTGTCYCGKFATVEAKAQCGLENSIIVEPKNAS